jgi:RNA polymerase sigma-70 factor (ECF subfamily)
MLCERRSADERLKEKSGRLHFGVRTNCVSRFRRLLRHTEVLVRRVPKTSKKPLLQAVPASRAFERIADEELVRRALAGDRWAHEAIFRHHVEAVMGLATRLLGRADEADDVVQDTFATALTSLHQLEEPSRLLPWLLRTAVHRAQRRLRVRRWKTFLGLEEEAVLSELVTSEASPETRAELKQIDKILRKLPVDKRVAWQLRHVEGHKLEEIAALTQTSLATVKRHVDAVEAELERAFGKERRHVGE